MNVALAQVNVTVGDFEKNALKILNFSWEAWRKGADIVVFPELSLCGYPPEDLLLKKSFIQEELETLKKMIKGLPDCVVILGLAYPENNYLYNSAGVVFKKELVSVYHKINLPNYGVFDEKRYFEPGKEAVVLQINESTMGIEICEDIWIENSVSEAQSFSGDAEIIINLSASPYHMGKGNIRQDILSKTAKRTRTQIFYCNLVGGQDELVFDGESMVIDEKGNLLKKAKKFEEDLIIVEVDSNSLCKKRFDDPEFKEKKRNFLSDIRIETVKLGKMELNKKNKEESQREEVSLSLSEEEEVYRALKLGLYDYVKKNNFKKVILGLSGGIDSALVATIASDSLGKENVVGLFMPSRFTSKESYEDAHKLAKNLGISLIKVSIEGPFVKFLDALKPYFENLPFNETEENIQARIRGVLLMAFSNKFGYLVLSTGNKSEYSVGYCTLYGDMVGGFALLKDVPKTLVYRLSEWRNKKEGYDLIPENVLKKAPTAELKENQKDQDILPPYELLDRIIHYYIEEDLSTIEIIEKGFSKEIVEKVIRAIDKAEYKRRQAPPGVKITPKAFGRDRRMPITHKYVL